MAAREGYEAAAALIADNLARAGVSHVFTMPSLGIDGLLAHLSADERLTVLAAWSESAATIAAQGYVSLARQPAAVVVDGLWASPATSVIGRVAADSHMPLITVTSDGQNTPPPRRARGPIRANLRHPVDGPVEWHGSTWAWTR